MSTVSGIRRMGSAALDLCYVAAGRLDGFWESSLSPWDVAAGVLMIREAKSPAIVREMLVAYLPERHHHAAEAVPA